MAIVRKYFGVSASGTGDGTSLDNRAALFSGGVWNTGITGFNYASDALECYITPGTYTITVVLTSFSGTVPSVSNPCMLIACDENGNLWTPPNSGWVSAMPEWDTSTMPLLRGSTNSIINQGGVGLYGLCVKAGVNGSTVNSAAFFRWCNIENSGSFASATAIGAAPTTLEYVVAKCTGTQFDKISGSAPAGIANQVRLIGNPAASGNRYGWQIANNATYIFDNLCVINTYGWGVAQSVNTNGVSIRMKNVLVYREQASGDFGIYNNGTATTPGHLRNSIIFNGGSYGINIANSGKVQLLDCYIANCASGNYDSSNLTPQITGVITESASELFVDPTNLDLRIKRTSAYWGRNLGCGDEPQPTTNIISRNHPLG